MKKLLITLMFPFITCIVPSQHAQNIDHVEIAKIDMVKQMFSAVKTIDDVYGNLLHLYDTVSEDRLLKAFNKVALEFRKSNLVFEDSVKQSFFDSLFTEKNISLALLEQDIYGIPASVTLAQAFIESKRYRGFRLSDFASESNNYFGIKYHKNSLIDGVHTVYTEEELAQSELNTLNREYTVLYNVGDKVRIRLEQEFAKFEGEDATERAFRLHSLVIARYDIEGNTYQEWTQGLVDNKYATASKYAVVLNKIIERYNLDELDYFKQEV